MDFLFSVLLGILIGSALTALATIIQVSIYILKPDPNQVDVTREYISAVYSFLAFLAWIVMCSLLAVSLLSKRFLPRPKRRTK